MKKKITEIDLAEIISNKIGTSRYSCQQFLTIFKEVVFDQIKNGFEVRLTSFGMFSARVRKGRVGINPNDPSKKIKVDSRITVRFKPSQILKKKLVNKVNKKD